MTAILAIIAQILPLLPTLAGDISALIKWIASIRTVAQQTGQWTAELETAFVNSLMALAIDPAWQPDALVAAEPPAPPAPGSVVTTTTVTPAAPAP